MLQAMRSSAKYIWVLIVVAFVGGFLVYESSGLFGRAPITPSTAVATVNGQEILFSVWQRTIQQLEAQQTQGSGYSLSLDEKKQIEERAFDQLVDEVLLQQEIKRRGITVTPDEVVQAAKFSPPPQLMESPELQTDGQFDYEKYLRFLNSPTAKQSGLLLQLEGYYQDQIPKQKLYEQIAAGVYPTEGQLWQNYRDTRDSAQVSFAVFRPTDAPDPSIKVSDSEIRAYYDSHKEELKRPGVAAVTYAVIPRTINASDSNAIRDRLLTLRSRILAGEKFEDVAKAESADSASAVDGGNLGVGVLGRFVEPFENAAKALQPGEISQPVLTQFGYHLIRLDSRKGDSLGLHHILLRITQSDSAASRTDRRADSLARFAAGADNPAKFDSAIKTLGLTPVRAFVTEGQPLVESGKVVPSVSAWAFSGPTVGHSSDLFDSEDGYYIARLESITPGGTPSFDAIKEEIRAELIHKKKLDQLVDVAQKFATAAAGSSLEQAGQVLNTPIEQSITFNRLSAVPGLGRANAAIGAAFSLPVNGISAPIKSDDAVYVLRVNRRVEADKAEYEKEKAGMRQQANQSLQRAHIQAFLVNLRDAAKIKDRRKEIQETIYKSGS